MIELRPLVEGDVAAHMAGEDAAVIEWLTGAAATWDSTALHFEMLASNAARCEGKRGFGVWLEEKLAGYIFDDFAAKRLGHRAVVASPTFPAVFAGVIQRHFLRRVELSEQRWIWSWSDTPSVSLAGRTDDA
ncbi:hypothetical protein KL953_12245 [Mycolicibacterium goodii]|uniref:hypothetical protein n=1 Tax=Mycolicibacterium goodii TaxID=134601 RepID=UPI001BDD44E0|nr:hypothetical protein [Mycolicibacterium goodii]MBU8809657.1 hypothetical protein [Mycolicibacterium goodii]ULN49846.1 hypothetical protein MI170_11185 [Mycolicibacterium goodii]